MKMKKMAGIFMAAAVAAGILSGCGQKEAAADTEIGRASCRERV